jgi:hypothetical protein
VVAVVPVGSVVSVGTVGSDSDSSLSLGVLLAEGVDGSSSPVSNRAAPSPTAPMTSTTPVMTSARTVFDRPGGGP